MKNFFLVLIIICSTLFTCKGQSNSKVWTKEYEQGLYNYIDSVTKPSMPDEKKRIRYIEFVITRLKRGVPNGLNSVSRDSIQSLNIKIGREYALQEYNTGNADIKPYYTTWTPLIEKTFRDNYIAIFQNKYPTTAGKFCDCIIKKLKSIYPDSILVPVPKDVNLKVANDCKSILDDDR